LALDNGDVLRLRAVTYWRAARSVAFGLVWWPIFGTAIVAMKVVPDFATARELTIKDDYRFTMEAG